jgi:OmpA-OmpF porin, OOP family
MSVIKNFAILVPSMLAVLSASGSSGNTDLINLGSNVNSKAIEINPHISGDGKTLFFVREGHEENKNFQDIWMAETDESGRWKPAVRLGAPLNTAEINGVESVSADGNKLLIEGYYKHGKFYSDGCSITRRTKDGWSVPEGINIAHFSFYDQGKYNNMCLSDDEKIMIFSICPVEDGEDNDLYISFKKADKSYSKPVRIGGKVNSKGHMDFAPFLAADNKTVYFSSNRPGGIGQTDIYKIERLDDTWLNWSEPVNLGPKVNTPGKEAYYTLDAKATHAYMVSENNSYGKADIVMVELEEHHKPKPVVMLKGFVHDARTNKPIDAALQYHDYPVDTVHGELHTDPVTGEYNITLPYDEHYAVTAHAHGYVTGFDSVSLKYEGEYVELTKHFYLTPIIRGEKVILHHVDFGVANILLPGAKVELDKLAKFLEQNQEVNIEIGSHTSEKDLENLISEARAKVVIEYLSSKGVKASRLSSKGYGDSKPILPNDTDERKKMNDRVEFTITQE